VYSVCTPRFRQRARVHSEPKPERIEIRIYVACLASYNNGILHGRWIDATQGVDHIWDEIDQVIKTSPTKGAEEHAIHDYEGFEDIRISEYLDIDTVCEISKFIQEHGEFQPA